MTITFEPVRDEHVRSLTQIFNDYIEHSVSLFILEPIHNDEMRTMLFFEDIRHKAFVILVDHNLAGFISIHSYNPRTAYHDTAEISLYLAPEYTGRGIGTSALKFIEAYAQGQGFHVLLGSIAGENAASIRLFEKLGYIKVGHFRELGYKHGRWLDVVYYEKIL